MSDLRQQPLPEHIIKQLQNWERGVPNALTPANPHTGLVFNPNTLQNPLLGRAGSILSTGPLFPPPPPFFK
jgi:hypothetical protein